MDALIKGLFTGAVAAFGLYVLSTQGRTGHPGLAELRRWKYAHRGLHDTEKPENSMAAFRAALENGYGIEFDIHLIKDGNLAVMHDRSLLRTTGIEGNITDLTTEELSNYHLCGTEETIPTFRQLLDLYDGKAPLIVELKPVKGNHAALCEAACKMLDSYNGVYCLESFDPRCVYWLKKNRPDLIRGQLTEDFVHNTKSPLHPVLKFILTHQLENFLCRPDFIAYKFRDRKTISMTLCKKLWKLETVTWTLISNEEYDTAVAEGWIPIFENFIP